MIPIAIWHAAMPLKDRSMEGILERIGIPNWPHPGRTGP